MSNDKWVKVPVEPTAEMLVAINWPNDPAGYRAMLAAAPQAPAAPDVAGLVEAADAALREIQDIMHEAYNSAYPVCCGRSGQECCGSPDPEWSEQDQRMMDRLAPHQRALHDALAAHQKREANHDD